MSTATLLSRNERVQKGCNYSSVYLHSLLSSLAFKPLCFIYNMYTIHCSFFLRAYRVRNVTIY